MLLRLSALGVWFSEEPCVRLFVLLILYLLSCKGKVGSHWSIHDLLFTGPVLGCLHGCLYLSLIFVRGLWLWVLSTSNATFIDHMLILISLNMGGSSSCSIAMQVDHSVYLTLNLTTHTSVASTIALSCDWVGLILYFFLLHSLMHGWSWCLRSSLVILLLLVPFLLSLVT